MLSQQRKLAHFRCFQPEMPAEEAVNNEHRMVFGYGTVSRACRMKKSTYLVRKPRLTSLAERMFKLDIPINAAQKSGFNSITSRGDNCFSFLRTLCWPRFHFRNRKSGRFASRT